jgi:hypothetical protein
MHPFVRARTAEIEASALYRPEEASVRFGVPYQRICEAFRRGHLAYTMIDRGKRVSGRDLRAWIDLVNSQELA